MSLDAHAPAPSLLRALASLAGLALVACSGTPKPLPNLPPPEYEPGRTVTMGATPPNPRSGLTDLAPKAAPAPAAPASPAPSVAPPSAPSSPPPPNG